MTLAVGDGANDVNMLTSAHIGVGISGKEGQAAVTASDYAIGQFKYLKPLIFYHGREAYRRNAYVTLYTFYKNILVALPQLWFGFFSQFSGQLVIENYLAQFYNTNFTALPIILYGLFDFEYTREEFLSDHKRYRPGLRCQYYNSRVFWRWFFYAVWQSVFLFFLSFFCMQFNPSSDGKIAGLYLVGNLCYGLTIILVNVKIVQSSYLHNFWTFFILSGTIASYFMMYWFFSLFTWNGLFGLFWPTFTFPEAAFMTFLIVFMLFPLDSFFYFVTSGARRYMDEREDKMEEARKLEEMEGIEQE